MTTPPLKKSIGRSPLRLNFLLAALALACLALMPFAQSGQAVGPEPDEGDLIVNMAEEDDAVADFSSDTENGAMGQQDQTPNHRMIRIDFDKRIPCAEDVRLRSQWHVHFKKISENDVEPVSAEWTQFSGTGKPTGRRYMANKKAFFPEKGVKNKDGVKTGTFVFEFQVAGPPNRPPKGDPNPRMTFSFKVKHTVSYTFDRGKVKSLKQGAIDIDCSK